MCRLIHVFSFLALVLSIHALVVNKSKTSSELEDDESEVCESLFVAILSKPSHKYRRAAVRAMWRDAGQDWGDITPRFVMCRPDPHEHHQLIRETRENDDMMFLPCQEGYLQGALTRKVRSAMNIFLNRYDHTYFMKVDDDTFVSPRRLCNLFKWRQTNGKDNLNAYFGVFAEGPREQVYSEHRPNRNVDSQWYEPVEKFSRDVYPVSAKGGPGYILSRKLVTPIIDLGIADVHELNNEDKAVGVWVDELLQLGMHVDIVNLPGTDGYDEHVDSYVTAGPYKKYAMTLHHHLTAQRISCLHNIDKARDPELHIDPCFLLSDGETVVGDL